MEFDNDAVMVRSMTLPQTMEMNLHEFAHTVGHPLDDGEKEFHDRKYDLRFGPADPTFAALLNSWVPWKSSIWFELSLQSNDP